jgi:hypothetical protein
LLKYIPTQTSCIAFRRKLVEPLLPIPESMRIQADGYLELLMVLVAPVLAIPETLSVYRIHGKNLCITDYLKSSPESVKRLVASNRTMLDEVKRWTTKHRRELQWSDTRPFFGQMLLPLEEHQFVFDPPGRVRFFWFLIRQNYTYSLQQTWRFTAFNYLSALSALIFGYRGKKWFYEFRGRTIEGLRSVINRSVMYAVQRRARQRR